MIITNVLKLVPLFNKSRLHKILEAKISVNKILPINFLKPRIDFYTTKKKYLIKWYLETIIETIDFKKYSFFAEKSYILNTNYLYISEKKKKKVTFSGLKFYNVKPTIRQVTYKGSLKKVERFSRVLRFRKKIVRNLIISKYKFKFFFVNLKHTLKIFTVALAEPHKIGMICANHFDDLMVAQFIRERRIFKIKSKAFWVISQELLSNINLLNILSKKIFNKILLKKIYTKLHRKYLLIFRYICKLINTIIKVFKRIPKRLTGVMLHILSFFYFWFFNSIREHKKNKLCIAFLKNSQKIGIISNNFFYTKLYKNICYIENLSRIKKGLLVTFYNFLYYIFNIATISSKYVLILRTTLLGFHSTRKTRRPPLPWFLKFFEYLQYYKRLKAYLRFKFKGKKNLAFRKKKKKFRLTTLIKKKLKKKQRIFLY